MRASLVLASVAAGCCPRVAAPPPLGPVAAPAQNRDRHGPHDTAEYIRQLESPKRAADLRVSEVIAALALRDGSVVADLGCGPGLFTLPLARANPHGVIYAVDVEPAELDRVNEHVREVGLTNVVPVLAVYEDPRLPPGSLDLLFIADTYHHFDDRPRYLARLRGLVKPGGKVAILDWEKQKNVDAAGQSIGPPLDHLFAREAVRAEMEAAGFHFVEAPALMPHHYLLLFRP